MGLNWKEASLTQLYEIIFNDKGVPLEHWIAARQELKRRSKKKHGRVNFREKARYAR